MLLTLFQEFFDRKIELQDAIDDPEVPLKLCTLLGVHSSAACLLQNLANYVSCDFQVGFEVWLGVLLLILQAGSDGARSIESGFTFSFQV